MDWGLQNRIAQIIKPTDNRALMLAVDHGYFLGPTEKLEVPRKAISPLLKHCDSLMYQMKKLLLVLRMLYDLMLVH